MKKDTKLFQPGDKVPISGIYEVIHDSLDGELHAHPHPVIAKEGEVFPKCKICHDSVRFRLAQAIEHLYENDFNVIVVIKHEKHLLKPLMTCSDRNVWILQNT